MVYAMSNSHVYIPLLGRHIHAKSHTDSREINNHNFEALYRKEPHARTRIRYLCMSHIEAGKSFAK